MNGPAWGSRRLGAAAVIALPDDADSAAVDALARRADGARFAGRRLIVIDLRGVERIETPILGELCAVLRGVVRGGGARFAIVGADPRVRWVLECCRIDGLELYHTVRAAQQRRRAQARRPIRGTWRGPRGRRSPDLTRSEG